MADWFVLRMLGRTHTILGVKFKVEWDTQEHCAIILRKERGEQVYTRIKQTFTSELAAHGYLNLLRSLNWTPQELRDQWRDIDATDTET